MPLNELSEAQQVSLTERAAVIAAGYLASGLTESISRATGLDEFEIEAQAEDRGGPRLIIAERIGKNLFVRVEQAFGAERATELTLEYQLARFLLLTGSVSETPGGTQRVRFRRVERGGIDLVLFYRF